MSATQPIGLAPVPTSIENPEAWEAIARETESRTGLPTVVTPELIRGMIAGAVPLLFAADGSRNSGLLRGTFADPVVAQCGRNAGNLMGEQPISTKVTLIGVHLVGGHAVVRARVTVDVRTAEGDRTVSRQFWDLQLGGQVTVGKPGCPNCGAPIGTGELICGHCHADVRSVIEIPLVVSRLELY